MLTDSLLCERYVRFSSSEYLQNGDYITSGMERCELAKSRVRSFPAPLIGFIALHNVEMFKQLDGSKRI
jgi:hypothetical protein